VAGVDQLAAKRQNRRWRFDRFAESGAGIIPNELGADWTPARRFPLGLRHSVPAAKLPVGLVGFSNTSTHALNLP